MPIWSQLVVAAANKYQITEMASPVKPRKVEDFVDADTEASAPLPRANRDPIDHFPALIQRMMVREWV